MLAPVRTRKKKAEVITNGGFSARIICDVTDGRRGWRLTWNAPDRRRRFFSDLDEAREQARRIVTELRAGRPAVANADASDLDELSRARRHLLNIDASIEQAVKEYAEAYKALGGRSVSGFIQAQIQRMGKLKEGTIAEVAAELIAEKEARGKGSSWVKSLRVFLLNKAAKTLTKPILLITPEDLGKFLSQWSGRTRNNYLTFFVLLFNFAKGKYLPAGEPTSAEKLERDVVTPSEVEIWTPEEAKKILDAADPDELPFFAISMFAGIRTREITLLDWSQVRPSDDPDESHIEIKAVGSKKQAGRRIVPILPALAAYLKAIKPPKTGRIVPNVNMTPRQFRIAAAAGLKWKHNASRHSFGSYRMAEIKNAYHVAEEMGNTPAMVKKHYFQAVTKAEAARFWAIRPE
jgi:integrase